MSSSSSYIQRVILIDGFNVMYSYKEAIKGLRDGHDKRMNPMGLLQLIQDLFQQGFTVRVVMSRIPDIEECCDRYILWELLRMKLLIFPVEMTREADDILMLGIAEEYGAMIISNDTFTNHRTYKHVAEHNTISYNLMVNPHYSPDVLKDELCFQYLIKIDAPYEKLLCYDYDPQYFNVVKSKEIFESMTPDSLKLFDFLLRYLHSSFCFIFGLPCSSTQGLLRINQPHPSHYRDFKLLLWEEMEDY